MNKATHLREMQQRLPDEIIIVDETSFEFTDDEFLGILSWLKYFNSHYSVFKKEKLPDVIFPIISKRLRLDFGLYVTPNDHERNKGQHNIYLTSNDNLVNGGRKKLSVKQLIQSWQL